MHVFGKDDAAITRVSASLTRPDGRTSSAEMKQFQGTNLDGAWEIVWTLPPNTAPDSVVYTVKAWMLDAKNRETRASPRVFVVLGRPAGPPRTPPRK
jgi:hypothetical protein